MKKFITSILMILFVLGLTYCSSSQEQQTQTTEPKKEEPKKEEPKKEEPKTPAKTKK